MKKLLCILALGTLLFGCFDMTNESVNYGMTPEQEESLAAQYGLTYEQFTALPEEQQQAIWESLTGD